MYMLLRKNIFIRYLHMFTGVYISIKNRNYSGMPQKIFKTFPKFRIFFLWIFSPKVFQDCFLSYCIKSFPKLRKKFPQISRIYQNFFYQTSKLFRKNTEIPKLFRYDYIRINGNIHPCMFILIDASTFILYINYYFFRQNK